MEKEKPETENKNLNDVPLEIKSVKLNQDEIKKLSEGDTIFLKNMLENGIKKDGYVKLEKDEEGNTSINFVYAEKELKIEDKILNHILTATEKEKLLKGEVLGPVKLDKNFTAYLQIDRKQNKIVVKTDKELGIPTKIGGYELNDDDKNRLANSQKMMPRIYKGKHGYFMATVKVTDDKKGLEYSGIVGLSNEEAQKLLPKINGTEKSTLDEILTVTQEVYENKGIKPDIENPEQIKTNQPKIVPKNGKEQGFVM